MNKLANYLKNAHNIVVLTGAGISTDSGIPDFRSRTGLYNTVTTAMIFSTWLFKLWPGRFYKTMGPMYKFLKDAKPNEGHKALARLEELGKTVRIVTQNVDGLHQAAGSSSVYEIHGTLDKLTCPRCGKTYSVADVEETILAGEKPKCTCGKVLKPDIVFFGDSLPQQPFLNAMRVMLDADLVLVIGTSLRVRPAADLPSYRVNGTPLVIINRDPTPWDNAADLVIHASISDTLSQAVNELERN